MSETGYRVSVVPFQPWGQAKRSSNEAFLSNHAWLPRELGLTHSKLQRLRNVLVGVVRRLDVELAVAALAIMYLQRLVWLRAVNKGNRKVVAACCLLLAHKFAAPQPPAEGVRAMMLPAQQGVPLDEDEGEQEGTLEEGGY